jgi:hypothetical protein
MKRISVHVVSISCAMAFAGAAFAGDNYHDLVRPHGQARSDAAFDADLDACYAQTGASRSQPDTPAFKTCMLGRRWRWQSYTKPKAAPGTVTYNRDSPNPNVGWHWQNGLRTCHSDCDDPEIPGSGYTCKNVTVLGMPMRDCTQHFGP